MDERFFDWKWFGQVAAVGGVVLSLLFVGYEVRQNTIVARIEASNNLEENFYAMRVSIWGDPDFARILNVGIEGDTADLTDVESLRLRVFFDQVLRGWQNAHYQYRVGTLDNEIWLAQERELAAILARNRGLAQHWKLVQTHYSEPFNTLIQSWLDKQD